MSSDLQTIVLCGTLLGFGISAMLAAFRVGSAIGEARQVLKDATETKAIVAMIPLMKQDLDAVRREMGELKDLTRTVSGRMHSDFPPMRERLDSVTDDMQEVKPALRTLETDLAVVKTKLGLSRPEIPAMRPPRLDPRRDPK
jgi:hypothetical protein